MKLRIETPVQIVTEADNVVDIRAEDETGAFGLRPGHADFLTRLSVSVLRWRDAEHQEHYVALRGGVLRVTGGALVEVATMEAESSDVLEDIQERLVSSFRNRDQEDEAERAAANRLHSATIRQLQRVLRASRETSPSDALPRLQPVNQDDGGAL